MNYKYRLILAILLLIAGCYSNTLASNFIQHQYPSQVTVNDILLDRITGDYPWAMKTAEAVLIVCFITALVLSFKYKDEVPKWLLIIAVFQFVRAMFISLTVFIPICNDSFLSRFASFSYGSFPSGHVSIPFLFFLFSYKRNKIWIFYLIATVLVSLGLLLSKNHYTIDILGTFFICYAIKKFIEGNPRFSFHK